MSDTEDSDSVTPFEVVLVYSMASMIALLILIFPFYVVVVKANRERERLLPVYPIISHFYKALRVFYFFFYVLIIYIIYRFCAYPDLGYIEILPHLSIMLPIFLMAIYAQAHNFMIILLSFQRFYLFFYQKEGTEKYIELYAVTIYLLFYLLHLFFFIWFSLSFPSSDVIVLAYMIFYGILNIVLLLSLFLYVLMILKIRSLMSLTSSNHNESLKFIFYQTFTTVLFKLSHSWVVCFLETSEFKFKYYIMLFLFMDLISTPGLIQVSYLLCNSKNMSVIRKRFNRINTSNWMSTFRSSQVHSMHQQDMATRV